MLRSLLKIQGKVKFMKKILILLSCLLLNAHALNFSSEKFYLGYRHIHTKEGNKAFKYMKKKIVHTFSRGRINIYELKKGYQFRKLPEFVKKHFFVLDKSSLSNLRDYQTGWKRNHKSSYVRKKSDAIIEAHLKKLSIDNYTETIKSIVTHGPRGNEEKIREHVISEFLKMGLKPIKDEYNVVTKIKGKSKKSIVIIGHMDTVSGTIGADDNASGAAGVLELARVSQEAFADKVPELTIYFVVSADEEIGLKGAHQFVKEMKESNLSEHIKFSINMDMIAYNKNQVVDLETNKKNKSLVEYFAVLVGKFTSLKANLVLQAWGSDHIPFLNNDIPALLTIENWKTHTPCWHKSCDTLDTLNFEYAMEILKLNFSAILDSTL